MKLHQPTIFFLYIRIAGCGLRLFLSPFSPTSVFRLICDSPYFFQIGVRRYLKSIPQEAIVMIMCLICKKKSNTVDPKLLTDKKIETNIRGVDRYLTAMMYNECFKKYKSGELDIKTKMALN